MSLASPYGTLRVPNISQDRIDGIGNWQTVDLVNAMMSGVSPDGRVWVTSGAAEHTAIYSARRALHTTLAADAAPQHVTFGRGVAYVTSGDAGTLRVQSLAGTRILRSTRIPVGSYNVQYRWGRVISPSLSRGTLSILDARGALLATVRVSSACHDACFAPA